MMKIKAANHHWWPICLSKHWREENGLINRIQPNGRLSKGPPKKSGLIKDGHNIKLKQGEDSSSPFDTSFEDEFDIDPCRQSRRLKLGRF